MALVTVLAIAAICISVAAVLLAYAMYRMTMYPKHGRRRVVDFDDPTIRDLAAFGSVVGLRFIPRVEPLGVESPDHDALAMVTIPNDIYGAMLQVAGAARSWRMGLPQAEDVLKDALARLDVAQDGERRGE